jgi:hypothetical protein
MSSGMAAPDPRLPLTILRHPAALLAALAQAGAAPAAVVAEAGTAMPPIAGLPVARFAPAAVRHPGFCACCRGRSPLAVALDRLFQARARGSGPWFDRVLVLAPSAPGRAMAQAALTGDVLTAARFRPDPADGD